jgi:outer membrane lipoprotein-sorting protein
VKQFYCKVNPVSMEKLLLAFFLSFPLLLSSQVNSNSAAENLSAAQALLDPKKPEEAMCRRTWCCHQVQLWWASKRITRSAVHLVTTPSSAAEDLF